MSYSGIHMVVELIGLCKTVQRKGESDQGVHWLPFHLQHFSVTKLLKLQ